MKTADAKYKRMKSGIGRGKDLDAKVKALSSSKKELKSHPYDLYLIHAKANQLVANVETRGLKHELQEIVNEKCDRDILTETHFQKMKMSLQAVLKDNKKLLGDMLGLLDESETTRHKFQILVEENKKLKLELEIFKDTQVLISRHAYSTEEVWEVADYEVAIAAMRKELNRKLKQVEIEKISLEQLMIKYRCDAETAQENLVRAQHEIDRLLIRISQCSCSQLMIKQTLHISKKDGSPELNKSDTKKVIYSTGDHDSPAGSYHNSSVSQVDSIKNINLPLSKQGSERLHLLRRLRLERHDGARIEDLRATRNKSWDAATSLLSESCVSASDYSEPHSHYREQDTIYSSKSGLSKQDNLSLTSSIATKQDSVSLIFERWFSPSSSEASCVLDNKNKRMSCNSINLIDVGDTWYEMHDDRVGSARTPLHSKIRNSATFFRRA